MHFSYNQHYSCFTCLFFHPCSGCLFFCFRLLFFLILILSLQIFDRLRKESPDVIKNVKAIEANFEAHDLNISQENKDIIWDEVDVRDICLFSQASKKALSIPLSLLHFIYSALDFSLLFLLLYLNVVISNNRIA